MRTARSGTGFRNCLLASGLIAAALTPCIAAAALGETETSVQTDAAQLQGSVKTLEHSTYRLHEIQLPSGTKLREFVGPDAKIFAVAWNGPTVPNLRQTFGRYFDTFVAAAKVARTGHNRLDIRQGDLVVQSSGHMRAFTGRAYLPQAIPAGVALGELH
jgi:hypothetical protein